MKNTIKKVFVVSMLLVGLIANAKSLEVPPTSIVKVESVNSQRFSLYVNAIYGEVKIQVKDIYGNKMHNEVLKDKKAYRKTYDISQLPEGTYYLRVSDNKSTKIFSIKNNTISLIEETIKYDI